MANPAWVPGVSGNPGGRPRGIAHVKRLARAETERSIQRLIQLRDHSEHDYVKLAAANSLLDRAWGKPFIDPESREQMTITIRKIIDGGDVQIVRGNGHDKNDPLLIEHEGETHEDTDRSDPADRIRNGS